MTTAPPTTEPTTTLRARIASHVNPRCDTTCRCQCQQVMCGCHDADLLATPAGRSS